MPNPTNSDPDGDNLFTFLEFQIGTHPLDSDTDNGGESDGSEYQRGAIPQDFPRDDAVRPVDVTGWAGSERVWLTFTAPPPGGHVKVFRGTDLAGPFVQIGQTDPGIKVYIDVVYNHTEYCYRTVTVNADQRESGGSEVICLTPRADPIAPQGHFVINQDATGTSNPTVLLTLDATDAPSDHHTESDQFPPVDERTEVSGVVEVMMSNFPNFQGGVWVAAGNLSVVEWNLEAGKPDRALNQNGRYLATVYVKFRDGAGNESEVSRDSIWVEPSGEDNRRLYLPSIQYQPSSAPVEVGAVSNGSLATGQLASQSLGNGLINGDFEEGPNVGWEEASAGGNPLVVEGSTYEGNYAAALCGYPSCRDSISQEVTIPTGGATLRYHYLITGDATCGRTFAVVQIGDTTVSRHDLCHNTGGSYKIESINLSAFAGQTVRIRFEAADSSGASLPRIRVDNVTLKRGIMSR